MNDANFSSEHQPGEFEEQQEKYQMEEFKIACARFEQAVQAFAQSSQEIGKVNSFNEMDSAFADLARLDTPSDKSVGLYINSIIRNLSDFFDRDNYKVLASDEQSTAWCAEKYTALFLLLEMWLDSYPVPDSERTGALSDLAFTITAIKDQYNRKTYDRTNPHYETVFGKYEALLERQIPTVVQLLEKGRPIGFILSSLQYSCGALPYEYKFKIAEHFTELGKKLKDSTVAIQFVFLTYTLFSEFPDVCSYMDTIIEDRLHNLGLKGKDLISAWKVSTDLDDLAEVMHKNLSTIFALEKSQAGSVKVLCEQFGIKDFARYPLDLLLRQYDERNNTSKPYGVIMYPRFDHGGAFYQDRAAFESLLKQLDGNYLLRVVECADKLDIKRSLTKLDRKYGSNFKISFAFIGGHGTEDSILFGDSKKRSQLHSDDLIDPRIDKTDQLFVENPSIILASCLTGVDDGLASELSKKFKARILAPDKTMGSFTVMVDITKDPIEFKIIYGKADEVKVHKEGRVLN
jgi:hypothetical protein